MQAPENDKDADEPKILGNDQEKGTTDKNGKDGHERDKPEPNGNGNGNGNANGPNGGSANGPGNGNATGAG